MAHLLPTLRLAALGTVVVFSIIVLGLSSHVTALTTTYYGVYFTFAALSIATAVLSILSLPAMIIIDRLRKGAFTSMILVELAWLGFLWILWLASAGTATQATVLSFALGCNYRNSDLNTACREFSAIQAFSFLNWLILLGYTLTLFAFSLVAANRGNAVWTSAVNSADFNAPVTPQHNHGDKTIAPQFSGASQPVYPVQTQYPPQGPVAPGWTGQPQSVPTPTQSPYPQV
ncbi:hypothetical protein BDZ94DRAFT_1317362 [Collybia nuda]|uniref:MARVEL domain-containing protein n=1 Tax=Collybia nuda TaxID=64659 RepID=A0A9P5YF08_9AGAR|nr:hypothetical protein BDZ94DRAFT_1317362 [Collybia nuda]